MAVLIASDLQKDMAGRPLLRGVSFKLERRDRMTIAGRNGAGKTTLLRILAGQESHDRGELVFAKGARVALHDQRPPRTAGSDGSVISLRDYVLSGCAQELAIEAQLAQLERAMGEGATDEATMSRYARAQAELEARGGYLWRDRATTMTRGLGFGEEDLDRGLDTFSGGQLTRASLARALATGADLIALDEPTNHLDIESLEWLEQTLLGLDAAIVLVAHDRWFLEAVGTSVLELEPGVSPRARFFSGTWHAWRAEQAAREMALGRAVEKQQAEIARIEAFVDRFRYKATKARQAQSRLKRLDRMERIEVRDQKARELQFDFKPPERSGRVIFELSHGLIEVGGGQGREPVTLLRDAELWLERGEHVALVGPNGTGKTTLIETLAGRRPLAAGRLSVGHNVKVGYLSQHAEELAAGGSPGQSVLEAAQRAMGLTPNKARAVLGRFLFSGEEAEKPLEGLSGGELRRLSLAVLVNPAQPPNVLILDEPTNHLDIESREALEDALRDFPGALLLVSHDRALLDAVGSRTIAIEDHALHTYLGGWPEYVRIREERREAGQADSSRPAPAGAVASPSAGSGPGGPAERKLDAAAAHGASGNGAAGKGRARNRKGPSKNRLSETAKAERAVEEAEAALQMLEEELSDPAAWASKYETAKSEARHTAARRAVESAYERLEALVD